MFIWTTLNNIINLVGISELIFSFILCYPSGPRYKYYIAGQFSTMALPKRATFSPHYSLPLVYYYIYGQNVLLLPYALFISLKPVQHAVIAHAPPISPYSLIFTPSYCRLYFPFHNRGDFSTF